MADRENHDGFFPNFIVDKIWPHDESQNAWNGNFFGKPAHFRETTEALSQPLEIIAELLSSSWIL